MWGDEAAPDYRAVLVPEGADNDICSAIGVTAFHCYGRNAFTPEIETRSSWEGWHYMNPTKRCPLPAYVPDVSHMTQRGGTFLFDAEKKLTYEHRDRGILGFSANPSYPLSFLFADQFSEQSSTQKATSP